jgi:hypothetical protein
MIGENSAMDNACKEFLKILNEAETKGSHLNVTQVSQRMSRIPQGVSANDVYELCKRNGWLMGSSWGPWITDRGKQHIAP